MSYGVSLVDPETNETLHTDYPHVAKGGTYQVGEVTECWLNITYNYSPHFVKVFGDEGIEFLDGISGKDSISILEGAIEQLGDDIDDDYWKPTEGNARFALVQMKLLATMRPDGVWSIGP